MMLFLIVTLCALFTFSQQATSADKCVCELTNSEQAFPHDKLSTVEENASKCNREITSQKTLELESAAGFGPTSPRAAGGRGNAGERE
ncbi:unnamed protein product [Pleuronectes platessa]|uniref:Secreted protein n=1 Tax=Pleuronectes platessa TaxID=8262 RepID=A0A9N7YKQ0_PLEPL|nr:unnamed protein product [Pleuronectes platessa]